MRECVILAGGLGTRLHSVVSDIPKCLAIVNKTPFLFYILSFLSKYNFNHYIFSLGYKSDLIIEFVTKLEFIKKKTFIVEEKQLGTGGAIKLALNSLVSDEFLIVNADTFFNFNIDKLFEFHHINKSLCSLTLNYMYNFDRYGSVVMNDNLIVKFEEKKYKSEAYINSGYVILNKSVFSNTNEDVFQLESLFTTDKFLIYGYKTEGYFIDIGIPEDYFKANIDFINYNEFKF